MRNLFLIHHTESKELRDPVTQKLHINHVVRQTNHLKDYSNNLLGVFSIDDIYWELNKENPDSNTFTDPWAPPQPVNSPKVPDDYHRNENRGYFFLRIGDFHKQMLPYPSHSGLTPECRLLHTPTKANYWHFSLRWFFDGKDLDRWTGSIEKLMKTVGKTFIIEHAILDEPYYTEIDSALYS